MHRDSAVSVPSASYGRRLIATTIEETAQAFPNRTYASIPNSATDISQGYRDLTWAEFASAIDRTAYWLDEHLPQPPSSSASSSDGSPRSSTPTNSDEDESTAGRNCPQTFTYFGPRDLRYILFLSAALKTGRRMLNTSPMGSLEAQVYLANASGCRIFLYAESLGGIVPEYVRDIPQQVKGATTMAAPSFEDMFFGKGDGVQQHYPYEKTWDEARRDEVAIFHTSGSSGFPKLVPYTNEMLARVDTWNLLDEVDGMAPCREYYVNKRLWIGLPLFHLGGALISLPCAVFLSTIPVLSGPTTIPTPAAFTQVHTHNASPPLDGIFVPPALLEDLVRDWPQHHAALSSFSIILFGGAPLSHAAGAALAPLGSLRTLIGSTEGCYWPTLRPVDDHIVDDGDDEQGRSMRATWDHIAPHPAMGAAFEHHADDLYELVVPRSADRSVAFTNFFAACETMGLGDDVEVIRTKDLFSPHPDPEVMKKGAGLWKYRGRTDDLVVLSGEVKMYAGKLEERIRCHPRVKHALVGGYQRRVPFLLLEIAQGVEVETEEQREGVLDEVWPVVEEANKHVGPRGKLRRELTLLAVKEKPFVRLGKGSVERRGTFARYEKEVDELYEGFQLGLDALVL
ncbi:AMP-binding enzyme [Lasiodiplodia theobromae]|nr:AMP-binding enzyme [Lasiodiplodia theobromae]